MSTSAHQPGESGVHWDRNGAASLRAERSNCICCVSDSPQVQCIQSYSSQEPDELSIEMADVLNLLERTEDGELSL